MDQRQDVTSDAPQPLTTKKIALFALPALPHAFISLPLSVVIPTFYAANTTVTLTQIALVATVSRLADAFIDPVIGILSDRTRSRLGRRKPWLMAAALMCAISVFFLFQPPADAGIAYFGIWAFILYIGFSFFEIPRNAWSTELSRNYMERSRIQTFVAVFNISGSLLFWVLPLLLYSLTQTTAITGTSLTAIGWLYAVLMPAAVIMAAIMVPNGHAPPPATSTFRSFMVALGRNKPLWIYFTAICFWGLGQGMYLSMIMIFLTDYVKLGTTFPFLMILFFVVQIAAMPIWLKIISRFGKHKAWAAGMTCDVLSRPLILFFIGQEVSLVPMVVLLCFGAFMNAPSNAAPAAILGDVIDYDILKTGKDKAGKYFAFNTLIIKAAMAGGAGAGLAIIGASGYQIGATNSETAKTSLLICYFLLPAIGLLLASLVIRRFPITRARQDIIRRRIERRGTDQPA